MSCTHGASTYRLLDSFVGWHAHSLHGALDTADGLRLKDPDAKKVRADVLTPHLPPPWLARGRGPCAWFLLGAGDRPALWMRDSCPAMSWVKLTDRLVRGEELTKPCALAVHRNWLAVADAEGECVFVWSIPDGRLVARFSVEKPGPIAFAPWGGLLVVSSERTLRWFSVTGEPHRESCVVKKPIHRLGRGRDGAVYAATGTSPDGPFRLMRITLVPAIPVDSFARPCDDPWRMKSERDRRGCWKQALPGTGVVVANKHGFCLEEPGADGAPEQHCFTRDGALRRTEEIVEALPSIMDPATLKTVWLDSGIPRCRWHRVRVDADVPPDTSVKVSVMVAEGEADEPPNYDDEDWEDLPTSDTLIRNQAAGRYLRVQIELKGHSATPIVHRVHLDFPRATSMDRLPPVYRDNPIAEDFTERFLGLFDASLEDTDGAVERFARLLNVAGAPREVLPWLASLFGVQLDPSWEETRVRDVLAALPRLYARRGTVAGLTDAIYLLFGTAPAIVEHAGVRPWGAVGSARLRGVRLFGKSAARFRLGHSTLGATGLVRYGNPDLDPFRNVAHGFSVLVPPLRLPVPYAVAQLNRLIERQKPAHTKHALRIGGQGFLVGHRSAVGIDTVFVPPLRAVLGQRRAPAQPGTARLNDRVALFPGSRRTRHGLEVGQALIGMSTVLE